MDKTIFQHFNNITFSELWSTQEEFVNAYHAVGFPQTFINSDGTTGTYVSDENLKFIWLLLIGRFADSTIKPYNTYGAFQVRFMSRVWQHAPAFLKNLEIQNKLRSMSLDSGSEIYDGSKEIYNNALNPGTAPGTNTDQELSYINQQNVTKRKRSKLEGLAMLTEFLKNDVTEEFLRRFDDFFKTIIYTGRELTYATYNEEE